MTIRRLLTVVLSVVLFAAIFSWISYVPSSQRDPDVLYFGFLEVFILVIIYAGPVYILVGLPLSIFIDKLVKKSNRKSKWGKYIAGVSLYSLAGAVVGVFYLVIFSQDQEVFRLQVGAYLIYGITASNFYFHLSLLISKISKRKGLTFD